MPVSAKTATKLREAMTRLLAGEPLHTDGALTKENLAREAQVSHATVHRAETILAEWDAKVPDRSSGPPEKCGETRTSMTSASNFARRSGRSRS
ncbi:hypothetical protein [Streptomyces sp. NPDC002676]